MQDLGYKSGLQWSEIHMERDKERAVGRGSFG